MLIRCLSCCLALLVVAEIRAGAYKPSDDSEILEKLPRVFLPAGRIPGASFDRTTNNVAEAIALAKAHISAYRVELDPRQLGYAQAVLQPWWTNPFAPHEILIARATIRQSLHDFNAALADLDLVLTHNPANAQSLLLRATILQVQGKYAEARAAAAQLLTVAPRHIAIAAIASVTSVNGAAQKSYDLLAATAANAQNVSTDQRTWMLTLLAEIAVRLGASEAAQRHFTEALSFSSDDTYALAAFADFLMDRNEPQRAFELVKDFDRIDGLLLRRALALHAITGSGSALQKDVMELQSRFAAAKLRGDFMHLREEGRFTLTLLDKPVAALVLARANWQVQREPADARLFLEAALATTNKVAAADVLTWMQETRIEDKSLAALATQLK